MKRLAVLFALTGSPAFAASGPFFSLFNTDFVVLIAFLVFIGVLVYFKVPGILIGLLDKRAEQIRNELDEARALREEAQTLLASYERKQREVSEQADRIVAHAREEAELAAEQAKADLQASIERRLKAAEEQIASAEAGAVREVRDRAVTIAIAASAEVIGAKTSAADQNKLIDSAIDEVSARFH
ncbi:F0F1 ATP synthase subunit B [Rhodobacteraceae bacterium W635]|uniref:F0F1 ATP synthase subunit B n=1 Tax=Nioella halotolerans TaxID=2303578 RepID=UPI000E3BD609|nr:F0F1 ATP synthase subunit B [Rhodobacteraceae bacterium W635]